MAVATAPNPAGVPVGYFFWGKAKAPPGGLVGLFVCKKCEARE